ncbi:hypothetical protein F0P96_10435 [Hymenobacter busanensis]|uniref:Uncharacterized protein n=1 Tax=Hymenobacter busanensis TaxID=2607656 RepID=A0A7L4ZYD1_9BACT|nr:hypothetical protein [Hymenobacter busanensis]KAA9333377.1 hypothetical protein F0P96_10435 [Hymenobacter busanensis]QHJ07943.1 hypothetical protein GUY19_11870 [Hymenobacter busanensis]
MNRRTPLHRTTPLRPAGGLPRVSPKQGQVNRAKRRVYDATKAATCFSCGEACQAPALTPSHILTQGRHQRQRLNTLNLVWECWPVHCLWENNKADYARRFPEAFAKKMERMQQLDPQAYAFFRMKNGGLFTANGVEQ